LFVSADFADAWYVTYTLFDFSNLRFSNLPYAEAVNQTFYIVVALLLALFAKNSMEIAKNFKPNIKYALTTALFLAASMLTFWESKEFLYFQF
jgi:hypothetical protein